MSLDSKTFFAPGKLMLVGDWSVLQSGNTSLSMTVDKGIHASCSPDNKFSVSAPDVGIEKIGFSVQNKSIFLEREIPELVFFESAFNTFLHYTDMGNVKPIEVHISSSISGKGGVHEKIGFGSSAALTVSLIAVLASHYGYSLGQEILYKLSYTAHYAAQRGKGSGFDIAASVYGGHVSYIMPEIEKIPIVDGFWDVNVLWQELKIEKIDIPYQKILIGYSGKGSSTGALIGLVREFKEKNSEYFVNIMNELDARVLESINHMKMKECEHAMISVKAIRSLFTELQFESNIEFETPRIKKMCDLAESLGGSAKFSGAGGGDSVIAFACTDDQFKKIQKSWENLGVDVIDVCLDKTGVREILS